MKKVGTMSESDVFKTYTLEEFDALPRKESWNYELIDGIILMSPRPSLTHQRIAWNIYFELRQALIGTLCHPIQEVDLVLNGNNFIPDLMIICNSKLEGPNYHEPPLIVIEILSPSSASRDYVLKRRKYEECGIREYWIISPEEKCVIVFDFSNHTDTTICTGTITSTSLPTLRIEINAIFA